MPKYAHVSYGLGFEMARSSALRCYGRVRLPSGRVAWRNYGRELKNGRGLSFVDVLKERVEGVVACSIL